MCDQDEEQWSTEKEDEDGESTSCQLYSYQVLEDATGHFSNTNKLGSGGFGTVFRVITGRRSIVFVCKSICEFYASYHRTLMRLFFYLRKPL
jgi:hypothetical protein